MHIDKKNKEIDMHLVIVDLLILEKCQRKY